MKTAISLSQIGLYNPQRQSAELSEELFVARQKEFNELMDFLNEEEPASVPQHHLIIASRGMGKTTLLKRIEVELHKQKYRTRFIPLLPPEEQYNLSDLTELWLNCLDELLESLETEKTSHKDEIRKIEKEIEKIKKEYKDSLDLSEKLYNYLMSVCKQMKRRPVLLIDNIGFAFHRLSKQEQNLLRGYLSEATCPIIIGAGVSMAGVSETKEHIINYKAPFYEFFQTHYLKKLELNELIEILYKLSEITQIEISINTQNRVYLQSLFQLTGGNPRTVVMLFKLLVKGFSNSIVDDLEALLDESTPLNKARFEELPTQQQIILNAIAQNWDPINLFDLSEATRYKNNQLSSQLNRLISDGWITTTMADKREWAETTKKSKENTIKGNAYSISERFLAIWLIMRNGRRKMKNEIRKVLESYEWIYGNDNLQKTEEKRNVGKMMITEKMKEQIEKDINQACVEKNYNKAIEMTKYLDEGKEKLSAMSYVYMKSGNYNDAEDKCREALALDNKDADNWSNLGHCLMFQQKFEEAEKAYRQAITLDNDNVEFKADLGICLSMQEKNNETIELLSEVIQLEPTNVIVYRLLGDAYDSSNDHKKAIEYYDKAIELNPNDAIVFKQRGYAYSMIEDSTKAMEDYTEAIAINPDYAFAYNDRGWEYTYGEHKDYTKAIADYSRAIELDTNCNARKHLMRLYRDIKNEFDKAEELFKELDVTKTPKDVYYLEQTLFELHKRNEGIASNYFEKALNEIENKLNPETQGNWEYFVAITIKLGYAKWLLNILSEKGFDIILSPFYVAIQALEIERTNKSETMEVYLKNQAVEKSEPARILMEKIRLYL